MKDLNDKILEVLVEKAPWEPTTKADQEKHDAEADASAHAIGAVLNTNVADMRDASDEMDKKLRATAADHKSKAMVSFKRYRELGGTKEISDLAMPFNPRKEWEAKHKQQWLRDHPRPKDSFGDRKKV